MNHLRQLQLRFQDYLTDDNQAFFKDIVSTEDALAEHRLAAYYNAYRIRLIDCLENDFKGFYEYLGTSNFELLMLDYLKIYPSTNKSVRWIGQNLPRFIAEQTEMKDWQFLYELCQFEWTQGLTFDASEARQIFKLDDMTTIPAEAWPSIRIQFQPGMRWLDLHWNVTQISIAAEKKQPLPEKNFSEVEIRWLIWRKKFTPNWRSLEVHEAWAIEAALNGANFAELCDGLLEWIDAEHVAITAAGFLKQWIADELVEEILTASD